VLDSHPQVSKPFPARIKASAAAAKDVRGPACRIEWPAQNQTAQRLIYELSVTGRNIDVTADANFARDKIIQSHTASSFASMADVGIEEIAQMSLRSHIAAKQIQRQFIRGV